MSRYCLSGRYTDSSGGKPKTGAAATTMHTPSAPTPGEGSTGICLARLSSETNGAFAALVKGCPSAGSASGS
jgi:hypothetical protein